MHNNLFQNTIKFPGTQTQTKTQQNFKALVTNPDTESDRNLGLALVTEPFSHPRRLLRGHLRMLGNEHLRR